VYIQIEGDYSREAALSIKKGVNSGDNISIEQWFHADFWQRTHIIAFLHKFLVALFFKLLHKSDTIVTGKYSFRMYFMMCSLVMNFQAGLDQQAPAFNLSANCFL